MSLVVALLVSSPAFHAPSGVASPVRANGLTHPALMRPTPMRPTPTMSAAFLPLQAIEPALAAYVAIWTPFFDAAKASGLAPDFLLHWGHGAAMATVLFTMGGYGSFLGWSTRLGNGETVYPLSLGEAARELHPKLMGAALFFFLLGGQGGLVLLATAGEPILQSAHSSTAVIGLALLGAQAALGFTMGGSELGRTAHAYLGSATMLALVAHAFNGLNLGLAF